MTTINATPEHLRRLASNQALNLLTFHRRMYRACIQHNKDKAEEVRQFVIERYGVDLATEGR